MLQSKLLVILHISDSPCKTFPFNKDYLSALFNLTSNSGYYSDGVVKEVWWTVLCIKFVCFLKEW